MHLGNSIICPYTGVPLIVAMGTLIFHSYKKARVDFKKESIPVVVALSAFVFALQMINFSIPSLNSSIHFIGAMLLAIMLGRHIGFLAISLILFIQALFFNDGGLLAIGCNIFNMGFLACFVAYPFIYQPIKNKFLATTLSITVAYSLGAIACSLEGYISGSITNLAPFIATMFTIHTIGGILEGLFTSVLILCLDKIKAKIMTLAICSVVLGGIISNFASKKPDGLEWSLMNLSDSFVAQTENSLYLFSNALQEKIANLMIMPDFLANIFGIALISLFAFTFCLFLRKEKA